jgi:thiol-disulfide isomerase/thioredoxin
MRTQCLILGILLSLAAVPRSPQTADDVVAKYIAATGGAEKWAGVHALAVSSRSPFFSFDAIWKKPDRLRIDVWSDASDDTDVRAFDGTTGWRLNSQEGATAPRTMSAGEILEMRDAFDMFELVDYKTKGHRIKLLGTAPINGQPAHKLELTRRNGEVRHLFLDQKTGLEVQRIRRARSPDGQDHEFVLPVGDYRPVGGLLLPHTVGEASRSYEVNGVISDARFQKPGAALEREHAQQKVAQATARLLPVGSPAPAWELKDPAGRLRRSSEFLGRVVVLDFWATWCAPCHRVMPELQRLHEDFATRGLVVLGVNTSERLGDPAQLMKDRGYTYTLLLSGETIADRYQVEGMPTTYVIGADGRILHADVGADAATADARRALIARQLSPHGRGPAGI